MFENWCKLCGSVDGVLKLDSDCGSIVLGLQIIKALSSETFVCLGCISFLNSCLEYSNKCRQIQQMFLEINASMSIFELNELRMKYGLEILAVECSSDNNKAENHDEINEDFEGDSFEQEIIEEYIFEDEDEYLKEEERGEKKTEKIDEEEVIVIEERRKKPSKNSRSQKNNNFENFYNFKCHQCDEEFKKMHLLSKHCKTIHNTNPQVECVICGKRMSSWKKLLEHKTKHFEDDDRSYSCNECNLNYKTLQAFEKHKERKHGENAEKFICSQCGKSFKEKQILKNHEKTHLPDELKLKYPCSFCEKKFVNNHCLKIHIARIHERTAFFFCEICGKGNVTKSDLLWHMDKHTQERNFTCDICNLKFKSTNSLRIHKRRHMAVKAMKACQICGKEFRSSAALSNHKLVHSDEKKYKCAFCPNTYKRLESYKNHCHSHSGLRPFKCQWCPKTFINSANCRKHKLKDHPQQVEEYEAIHGKKGVSLAIKIS